MLLCNAPSRKTTGCAPDAWNSFHDFTALCLEPTAIEFNPSGGIYPFFNVFCGDESAYTGACWVRSDADTVFAYCATQYQSA